MALLKDFFTHDDPNNKGVTQKKLLTKKSMIAYMAVNKETTLAELSKRLNVSIPTVTKLMGELAAEGVVADMGKVETSGGRRPNVFRLADTAIFFVGVEIASDFIRYVLTDIQNRVVKESADTDFELYDNAECLEYICGGITSFIDGCGAERSRILGIGVCIAGRVNPASGQSHLYFSTGEKSLRDVIEQSTQIKVLLENGTRAKCYAEYFTDGTNAEKNALYLHLGMGVAAGIIIDGRLYYGKSGFAGEFGHTPFFNNEKICMCGKKGCLETEISGTAIEEYMANEIRNGVNTILKERYEAGENIRVDDIIEAAKNSDILSIDIIEEAGEKAGKSIAFLINIFNPEVVIIGGILSQAGDYLMLPLQSAANKYSLGLVYKDTRFRLARLGAEAGCTGAAMLIRNHIIGL